MECENVTAGKNHLQWRVLHVIPNHEKKVAMHLLNRSLEHFLPLYSERSRWSDRNVTLERPLFPGYVFARFDRESRRAVISSPGVIRVLGNRQDEAVEADEINKIRTAIATGCVLRPHPAITVGTQVRVSGGVFAGTEGLVVELRSHCKVIISMSAVKQCYSLETDIRNVEVLGSKAISVECKPTLASRASMRA
jgi:transcription antitermination factor NusG